MPNSYLLVLDLVWLSWWSWIASHREESRPRPLLNGCRIESFAICDVHAAGELHGAANVVDCLVRREMTVTRCTYCQATRETWKTSLDVYVFLLIVPSRGLSRAGQLLLLATRPQVEVRGKTSSSYVTILAANRTIALPS